MVTEAGKELLRNTINTANFHNKILEQNEMWKQWEIERGLTMMVSDDDILKKIRKHHRCAKHQKLADGQEWSRSNMNTGAVPGTSSADRWDHNGFKELYPDEPNERRPSASSSNLKEHCKKWGHSGFRRLYPEESGRERSSSASSSSKGVARKCDPDLSSDDSPERKLALSSGKKCKRKCRRRRARFFKALKERKYMLTNSKKCDKKPNYLTYEEQYQNEVIKRTTLSSRSNKLDKSQSFSPRRHVRRSSSPPLKERDKKSNYLSYEEQYRNEVIKQTASSPRSNEHAKRLSFSPRRHVQRSLSPALKEHVKKSNYLSYEEQYQNEVNKRTASPPRSYKHVKPLSCSSKRHVGRSLSPPLKERVKKSNYLSYEEQYRNELIKRTTVRRSLTPPLKELVKSNMFSYEELYRSEFIKRASLSPIPKKRSKRTPKLVRRSERNTTKWDHDGFLKMYPEERLKKKSSRLKKC